MVLWRLWSLQIIIDDDECKKKLDPRELAFTSINLGVLGNNQSLEDVIDMKAKVGSKSITCKTIKNGQSASMSASTSFVYSTVISCDL